MWCAQGHHARRRLCALCTHCAVTSIHPPLAPVCAQKMAQRDNKNWPAQNVMYTHVCSLQCAPLGFLCSSAPHPHPTPPCPSDAPLPATTRATAPTASCSIQRSQRPVRPEQHHVQPRPLACKPPIPPNLPALHHPSPPPPHYSTPAPTRLPRACALLFSFCLIF